MCVCVCVIHAGLIPAFAHIWRYTGPNIPLGPDANPRNTVKTGVCMRVLRSYPGHARGSKETLEIENHSKQQTMLEKLLL